MIKPLENLPKNLERTLVLVKPDGVRRMLVGEILSRLEAKGFRIAALKMVRVTPAMAARHYAAHRGKPFYPSLLEFITSGPVAAAVVEGPAAAAAVRMLMGGTYALEAAPGTIRGDLAWDRQNNLVHGSDSPESARREIPIFFRPAEIHPVSRVPAAWES